MFITGTSRDQLNLFEEKLDELISSENPSRFIDAYVDKLDLKKIGFKIPGTHGGKGRPAYEPSMMLKIYIYGYLNRIRSSRKLEAECNRNIEMIWLTNRLFPDFKTIADFRKDNKKGIKTIFREFLNLCQKLELLSFQCVAIDGTKERAKNHLDNIYRKEAIEKIGLRIQDQIEKYLDELEKNDKSEEAEYEFLSKNLREKLAKLNKSQDKIDIIKQVFCENPELEIYFANDTDSRYMKDNNRISAGYNCQTAVDEKNKLIIAHDVTNESNDQHQLNNMKDRVSALKNDFKIDSKTIVVADAGYFEEKEILKAEEDECFEIYVSHPRDSHDQKTKIKEEENKIPAKGFLKDDFKYDKGRDVFECPEGKELRKIGNGFIDRRTGTRKFKYSCRECDECNKKKSCTNDKNGRSIKVTEFFNEINEFREKCNSDIGKRLLAKRKEIVEHPFGTIKHSWGYRQFMQKGKETVSAEFSFIAFIYNFRRVLNLVDFDKLMDALVTV
ncbi:IS1182 family transposase [Candidatus Dependentiae bacterium]|nr:IS1182 family transposase [Candidatus Dependentiae bacterium]